MGHPCWWWMTDRKARVVWLGLAGWVLLAGTLPAVLAGGVADAPVAADPNAACAGCHRDIYLRYRTTPMARASGAAADGFIPGSYTSAASGVSYKIAERDGRVWLSYERAAARPDDGRGLKGERELRYFLGSGTRGRTYLFEDEVQGQGYWFEIPINWYAKKRVWEMAPNYAKDAEMPLTMPVDPGCLRCHASGAQASLPEARNKYAGAPFLAGGITCVSCHEGSGAGGVSAAEHIASGGKAAMLRIGALEPVRRDSVCLSCHLEGDQAVVHAGKRLVDFRPGESVFKYASYFVASDGGAGTGRRATSQWEALLRSGCKRGAGDALTCTSCHDPHSSTVGMGAAERVEFYRGKCLSCHDGKSGCEVRSVKCEKQTGGDAGVKGFGASHHPEERDCAACHMPRATANDIAHEQVTDHSIPRVPISRAPSEEKALVNASVAGRLVAVGSSVGVPGISSERDLGLAYALAASRGDRAAGEMALPLLRRAEAGTVGSGAAGDALLHEQLGFLEQMAGDREAAVREYGLALEADPHDAVAAGNLAVLKVGSREYLEAIGLLERAFGEDPGELKAGMNLALVECGVGRKEAALGVLDRMLEFSPDDGAARELARGIRVGSHGCGKN
jgi:hypothetical protein